MEFEGELSGCGFEAALCLELRPCERGLTRHWLIFVSLTKSLSLQSLVHHLEVTDSATSASLEVFTAEWAVD